MRFTPTSLLITGASSGIGRALALEYAAPGMRLVLSGRDPQRLAEISELCRAQGARVEGQQLDVQDRAATAAWVTATDHQQPLDLVIANAGISGGTGVDGS